MDLQLAVQGLGNIGRAFLKKYDGEIIGVADLKYEGEQLETIIGGKSDLRVTDIEKVLVKKPDVLLITTTSKFKEVKPDIENAVKKGINVVTAAEELFYPQYGFKKQAEELDKLAKKHSVSITGRGVNPGCVMDAFPAWYVTQRCDEYEEIVIYRWDDTMDRRNSLLEKTGYGLTVQEFLEKRREGKIGHKGLVMSARYLADKFRCENYSLTFGRRPILTTQPIKALHGKFIETGKVAGLHEVVNISNSETKIRLDLRLAAYIKEENGCRYKGKKEGRKVKGEIIYDDIVNGDEATVRILEDAIKRAKDEPAGLNAGTYIPNPWRLLKK